MKQKFSRFFIALAFTAISAGATAQTWNCGTPNAGDVTATLVNGTLTISGTGDMEGYSGTYSPFRESGTPITKVVVENGVTSIGAFAFMECAVSELIISNSVERIEYMSFSYCPLTEVTIPNSVTSIELFALNSAAINVLPGNTHYSSENGVLFNQDKTKLITFPRGKQGTYTIPNGVINIEDYAFQYRSGLTEITVPGSVETIGEYAFDACSNLTAITFLGDRPTLGDRVFYSIPEYQLTLYCPNGNTTWDSFSYSGVYVERLPGISVSVTFNSDGGSPVATQEVNSGEKVIYPLKPVKEGYIFIGWYNNDIEFDFATPVTESITLTAKWQQDLTEENETLAGQVATLTTANETLTTQNTSLQTQVNNLTEENETLEGQVTALTEEKMELNGEIAAIQQQLEGCATSTVIRSAELNSSLSIYPNPVTNGELRIESGELQAGEAITVYNQSGALVAAYQAAGEQTTINISHLPSGAYLVKVKNLSELVIKN